MTGEGTSLSSSPRKTHEFLLRGGRADRAVKPRGRPRLDQERGSSPEVRCRA